MGRRTRIGPRSASGKPPAPDDAGGRSGQRPSRSGRRPGRAPAPGPDRRPGAGWRTAAAPAGWLRCPAPDPLRPGSRRPSAPFGGRTNWPRSRIAGGGPRRAPRRRQPPPTVEGPPGLGHPPHDRLIGAGAGLAPAEGAEVVGAQQDVGRRRHGAQVQRIAYVPGGRVQQGVGRGSVPHQVAVAAGRRRAAGVELVGHRGGREHDDGGCHLAVEGPGQPEPVEGDGRQVDVDHLAPRMHPGVGAAGTGQHRRFGQPSRAAQGGPQGAGHRRQLGLERKTPEGGAVVGHQEPPALPRSVGVLGHAQADAGFRRTQSAPSARCRPAAGPA